MPNKFFNFQNKHKILVIIVITLITVFFTINALKIKINADFTTIFNQTEATVYQVDGSFNEDEVNSLLLIYKDIEKIDPIKIANNPILESFNDAADVEYPIVNEVEKDKKKSSSLLLMIKSEYLFTPVYLNTLDICLQNLLNSAEVQSMSSVFDYVTIEKKGTRLKVSPISSHKIGEKWSDEEVETLKLKIANDPTATGYLVSQNLDSILFLISISDLNESEIYELLKYFEPLNQFDSNYAITGALPINYRVMYYLTHDLSILLILCFVIILLIFYLSFRAKRSMILPFFLSILAIIWTFGTMSLLNIPITIINIITPCMVLVLGSSYSVHIVSEYYSKFNNGIREDLAPIAASSIYKTIILAGLTTIAGFISLLVSKVNSLKEFGLVVSIGIVYCIIISLTLIPIILSLLKNPKEKQSKVVKSGLLTKIINKLSNLVINKWLIFIIVYLLIIFGFLFFKDKVKVDTNYMAYFPSSSISSDTMQDGYGINFIVALREFSNTSTYSGITYNKDFLGYKYGGDALVFNHSNKFKFLNNKLTLETNYFVMLHGVNSIDTLWAPVGGNVDDPGFLSLISNDETLSGLSITEVFGIYSDLEIANNISIFEQLDYIKLYNYDHMGSNVKDFQLTFGLNVSI